MAKIKITRFPRMEFSYNFHCFLNCRNNLNYIEGKSGNFSDIPFPIQRSVNYLFLIAAEDHELRRCCEVFNICNIVDKKRTKHKKLIL